MNAKIAIYPGTFDPLTKGHEDVVRRATLLFDKVIVAIAGNEIKKPCFPLEERVTLAKTIFSDAANVEVCGFSTLLIDFAREKQASVIVRGLRAVSDFEYEFQLAAMNRKLNASLETIFLTPSVEYSYISSSLVREIANLNGELSPFVHPLVEAALRKKQVK